MLIVAFTFASLQGEDPTNLQVPQGVGEIPRKFNEVSGAKNAKNPPFFCNWAGKFSGTKTRISVILGFK